MGRTQAEGFAVAVAEGMVNLDGALQYHFTSNHYPPLPVSLIPLAKRIIETVSDDAGRVDEMVNLPDGRLWKGKAKAPVSECIEAWHLDSFIQWE